MACLEVRGVRVCTRVLRAARLVAGLSPMSGLPGLRKTPASELVVWMVVKGLAL